MGQYFKPWRRKIGVVTLLMACVLMAGWFRSWFFSECVCFYSGRQSLEFFENGDNRIWWIHYYPNPESETSNFNKSYRGRNVRPFFTEEKWAHVPIFGQNIFYEFSYCNVSSAEATGFLCTVPHGAFVIPLTLLSAWLLLSKPRTKTKLESVPAIPN